jgi:hypothetical protein
MRIIKLTATIMAAILVVSITSIGLATNTIAVESGVDDYAQQVTLEIDPEDPSVSAGVNLGGVGAAVEVDLSGDGDSNGDNGGGGNNGGSGGSGDNNGGSGVNNGGNGDGSMSDGFFGFFRTSADENEEETQVGPLAALGDFIEVNWMILLVILALVAVLLLISRR